ncbi:MAG: sugar ABC transporter permease [Deinococcus sp.]|nr:sugar ABC transporter permease [Deinococcus sp.]
MSPPKALAHPPLLSTSLQGFLVAFERHDWPSAFVCLLPVALIFGLFNIYPALYSVFLSFFRWDGFNLQREFVGLDNYRTLVHSGAFWHSVLVTFYYASGATLLSLVLGLALATALNSNLAGRTIYRTLYFLPVVTPMVAAGVVWQRLFDPTHGVINGALSWLGVTGPNWLSDPAWAMPALILVGTWRRAGFNLVVYLAALQAVPRIYYEAARLDGASAWALFRFITVPLVAPASLFLAITSLIDGFQMLDLVFVMTNGGPLDATNVLGFYLYQNAFRFFKLGYASAVAYAIFALIFLVTLVQWRLVGRRAEVAYQEAA